MRSVKAVVAALLIVVLAASPAYACKRRRHGTTETHHKTNKLRWSDVLFGGITPADRAPGAAARAQSPGTKDLSAYAGLASWVDIFNTKPWRTPARAVRTMHARGAKTIFLQTSTYGHGRGIYDDGAVEVYLREAHRRGMKVIAWYVPAFDQQKVDLRRIRQAIRYRSASGDRFDSFGLDIEATNVGNIALRNRRLLSLSRRIRDVAGPNYPLAAITPDPVEASYWPNFPYRELVKTFDVFVPMGYFTFRADGYRDVHDYTVKGIRKIRRETGDPEVPIHFIGGIADDAGRPELKGFVKAARDQGISGASLYDYPITSRESWFEMRAFSKNVAARRRVAAAKREEAEAERQRHRREKERNRAKNKRERRDAKKARGKAARKGSKDDNKRRDVSSKRSKKKRDHAAKGRRSPSSSASHRDKESAARRERERPRRRSLDRRLLRS